jgi:predicted DCC family thiol-disulfide oxidoreductase YuxK
VPVGQYASLTLFYDGDCPLCSRYALYQRLREAAAHVDLIDARNMSSQDWMSLRDAGIDINNGVVIRVVTSDGQRQFHAGRSAMAFLAAFDDRSGVFSRAHRWFRVRWFGVLAYPVLYQGRRALLVLLRIPRRIPPPQ